MAPSGGLTEIAVSIREGSVIPPPRLNMSKATDRSINRDTRRGTTPSIAAPRIQRCNPKESSLKLELVKVLIRSQPEFGK
jgi:hypothetical protein